jgi:transcriptional regulator with XRE-family HTH domain
VAWTRSPARSDGPSADTGCARLSQEDLAERSQLHRTYVSLVERGQRNVTVEALRRIGDAVGVPAWRILADAEEET